MRTIPLLSLRSEEHTSELQSRPHLVCRLLLEKKNDHPGLDGREPHAPPRGPAPPALSFPVPALGARRWAPPRASAARARGDGAPAPGRCLRSGTRLLTTEATARLREARVYHACRGWEVASGQAPTWAVVRGGDWHRG